MFLKGTLFGYVSRKPLSASHIPNMNSDLAYVSPSQSPVSMSMPFSLYIHKVHRARDVSPSRGVYEFLNTLLRRHRPHDVKRIRLSRHGAQRGTVLDPLGLVGDLVVRDAARPVGLVELLALLSADLRPLGLGFGLDFCGVFEELDGSVF